MYVEAHWQAVDSRLSVKAFPILVSVFGPITLISTISKFL